MAAKNTLQFFLGPLLKKFFQDMGRDPNNLEMILIKQKAGQLLKDSNKVINFPQKRSFAEEIKAMKKSGDLVDEDNIIISDKITDREMFKNSNLNKPTVEGQMEKITGASNKINQAQKEIDEMYRPKTDAEIKAKFDKQNQESIQRFKDKMKKDEPEDKADGGRIGFRAGKFVLDKIIAKLLGDPKKVKQAADDIFPTGDYKYDAQMAAEALVENNPKIFKNKLYDDLDMDTQIEIYGAVLGPIQKNMSIARQLKKASRPEKTLAAMKEGKGIDMSDPNIADEFTRFMKETDPQGSKKLEQTVELANFDPKGRKKNATGGRAEYKNGLKVYPKITASKSNQGLGNGKNVDLQDLTYGGTLMYDQGPFSAGIEYLKGKDKFDFKNKDETLAKDTTDRELANLILMMKLKNGSIKLKGNKDNQMISISKSFAQGGRIGFSGGGKGIMSALKNFLKPAKSSGDDVKDFLSKRQFMKSLFGNTEKNKQARQLAEILEAAKKAREEGGFKFTNVDVEKDIRPLFDKEIAKSLKKNRKLNATGGRAGFYTGGITDVEPSLDDIGHGSDALMARTRLMSPGAQATTSTGLNYLLAEDNDNMRVPFAGGGDPKRRAFLKLIAALTGGAAAFKTGILGIGGGTGKKTVTETVKKAAESGGQVPPYFLNLVSKIKTMGKDTPKLATKDREKVTTYKDYTLTEDLTTGEKTIQRMKVLDDGSEAYYGQPLTEETYMSYKPGKGQMDETTKGKTPPDEYEEGTAFIRSDKEFAGDVVDESFEISDDVIKEGTIFEDTLSEFGKADGGRIGFRFGGKGPGEIVQDEKKQIEADKKMFEDFEMKFSPDGIVMDPPPIPFNFKGTEEKITTLDRPDIKNVDVMNLLDTTTPMFDKDNIVKYDDGTVYYKDTDQYVITDEDGEPIEVMGPGEGAKIVPKTVEAADGGRIGFSAGSLAKLGITGSSRRFLEKVFGKERFATMIENDPRMHRGMLEVVEMFRKKDKEGLKMYMQKFLPHMDDEMVEDFIVGSDGSEGITGQLIRLGSGREYKSLIDLKKQADNVRKLEDFDIDGVSKNAEGGRIGFSGGGILRAIIAKSAAKKGLSVTDFIKATNYKGLPPEVRMFISPEDFAKLKGGQKEMYDNYIDMAKTRLEFQKNVEGGKKTPAALLFKNLEKTMDEQSFVPKTVTADDIAEMELMVKNRFNKGRKDNALGGLQTMLGE